MKESKKYQKAVDIENKANIALWIIIILVVLLTIGSVVYCKVQKKCCFQEKDEVSTHEGGESDKNLFKKEVKSKNSKKKNTKESLMPSFQVAEEQA